MVDLAFSVHGAKLMVEWSWISRWPGGYGRNISFNNATTNNPEQLFAKAKTIGNSAKCHHKFMARN